MESLGFFVVPLARQAEVVALSERWREAFDELREDWVVLDNEFYRGARAMAIESVEFPGIPALSVREQLSTVVFKPAGIPSGTDILSPDQSREYAAVVARLEKRRGGEDGIVARMAKRHFVTPPETLLEIYRAFKATLAAAAENRALAVRAVLDDTAEAWLAARIAEREYRDRKYAAMTPEERAAAAARSRASMADLKRKLADNPDHFVSQFAAIRLHLLDDADIAPIRAIADKEYQPGGDLDDVPVYERIDQIIEMAGKQASEIVAIEGDTEADAMNELDLMLGSTLHGAAQVTRVYSAAEALLYHESIGRWEAAQGGEDGAIDRLTRRVERRRRPVAEKVYRTFRDALARAVSRGLGFVLTRHYVTDDGAR